MGKESNGDVNIISITLKAVQVEAYNSVGIVKRYHALVYKRDHAFTLLHALFTLAEHFSHLLSTHPI